MSKKIFVVSDTWFNRPFGEFADMLVVDYNNEIINTWNKHIGKNDIVYVLGGFGISDIYSIVVQLSGEIHFLNNFYTSDEILCMDTLQELINNSIDKKLAKKIILEDRQIITLCDEDCVLSYLPLCDWFGKDSGTYCFHGYTTDNDIIGHNISCNLNMNKLKPICISSIKKTIDSINDNLEY